MKFHAIKLSPNSPNRGDVAEENFNQETKELRECFWREFVQNFLDLDEHDQKRKKKLLVKVIKNEDVPDNAFLKKLLDKPRKWLRQLSYPDPECQQEPGILVIEEINTRGICGKTNPNRAEDNEDQLWTNFWFTDGKPTKTGSKRGRRGQGKVTYHSISGFRSVFAITKRADDHKTLLFGKCRLKSTFRSGNVRYDHYGLFGKPDSKTKVILPVGNKDEVGTFENKLGIPHRAGYGTTWVFPFADLKDFTFKDILEILAREYCYAIISEDLIVEFGGETIDRERLPGLVESHGLTDPSQEKIDFLEGCRTAPISPLPDTWKGANQYLPMKEDTFSEDDIGGLRDKLDNEELIAFELPVDVEPKGEETKKSKISVFLKIGPQLEKTDEQIIRSSLLIAKEQPLSSVPGKFYGLVIAKDDPIATFLSESEDAAHMAFNEKRVLNKYENARSTLQSVRWALPQLARTLGFSEKKDFDALAEFFSISTDTGKIGGAGRTKSTPGPVTPPLPPIPPPSEPPMFRCQQNGGKFQLERDPQYDRILPTRISMSFGYETGYGVGDPIKKWKSYDFDLEDSGKHVVSLEEAKLLNQHGNTVEVEITGTDPKVSVGGFSEITRVKVQIYEVTL